MTGEQRTDDGVLMTEDRGQRVKNKQQMKPEDIAQNIDDCAECCNIRIKSELKATYQ